MIGSLFIGLFFTDPHFNCFFVGFCSYGILYKQYLLIQEWLYSSFSLIVLSAFARAPASF